jgi:hypothetical protein
LKSESKEENIRHENIPLDRVEIHVKRSVRIDVSQKLDRSWTTKCRLEVVEVHSALERHRGHMQYFDLIFKPNRGRILFSSRWQVYSVADYRARIYSFEQDVAYSYGMKMLDGKGTMLSFKVQLDINQRVRVWFRVAGVLNDRRQKTGGLGAVQGDSNGPEGKIQIRYEL